MTKTKSNVPSIAAQDFRAASTLLPLGFVPTSVALKLPLGTPPFVVRQYKAAVMALGDFILRSCAIVPQEGTEAVQWGRITYEALVESKQALLDGGWWMEGRASLTKFDGTHWQCGLTWLVQSGNLNQFPVKKGTSSAYSPSASLLTLLATSLTAR